MRSISGGSVRTYEETRTGIIFDEHFWKVAEFCIQLIKEKKSELGGDLDVEIPHPTVISSLPFLFFFPEKAEYFFKAYHYDVPLQSELSGAVWQRKDGINLIRDLYRVEVDKSILRCFRFKTVTQRLRDRD